MSCFICDCCESVNVKCNECGGDGRSGYASCLRCYGEGSFDVCKGGCYYSGVSQHRHILVDEKKENK